MGWLMGWHSRQALVDHLLKRSENDHLVQEPIAKFFSGNDMWTVWEERRKPSALQALANESTDPVGTGKRFIVLFKLDGGRNKVWGYKPIEESCGPCETSCPLKFLEMVPATTSSYADGWRDRVKAYWKERAERRRYYREARGGLRATWAVRA